MILIHEIYRSIQGESSFVGVPCVFVRLTGCDLRCAYCDTAYAFKGGRPMSLEQIIQAILNEQTSLIELTGGEPLLQKESVELAQQLCDLGKTVLIETNGAHDISKLDPRVVRIMDWKCPSSGESRRNLESNLLYLQPHDEIKFVIGTREDFEWACQEIRKHRLDQKTDTLLFSPVFKTAPTPEETHGHDGLLPQTLCEWILEEKIPVRFQLQIHKYVWNPLQRGV